MLPNWFRPDRARCSVSFIADDHTKRSVICLQTQDNSDFDSAWRMGRSAVVHRQQLEDLLHDGASCYGIRSKLSDQVQHVTVSSRHRVSFGWFVTAFDGDPAARTGVNGKNCSWHSY
jgi:hypothetical protein